MARSRYFVITPEGTLDRAKTLTDALARRKAGGFIWLDLANPSAETLGALVKPLKLHPLAIEDCLDEDQVPKMEEFPGHTFILFNRYLYADESTTVEEVNFFLGEGLLVSVHSHGREDVSFAERLEAVVRRDLEQVRRGPDFLLQLLLDDIVDEKFEAIEALQDRLDVIEEELLRSVTEFRPARLIHLRRALLRLRKSLVYEREVLVKMCRRDSPFITADAIYDFRDIYDHLAKFFEVIEICRELVASIIEIHLSMVNNQITMAANKTNFVVRRLTLITTVFMPLTLLAGIGGMSEWSMITGPHNWRIAYPLFMALMAAIAAVNYLVLRWADSRDPTDVPLYPSSEPSGEEAASDAAQGRGAAAPDRGE